MGLKISINMCRIWAEIETICRLVGHISAPHLVDNWHIVWATKCLQPEADLWWLREISLIMSEGVGNLGAFWVFH